MSHHKIDQTLILKMASVKSPEQIYVIVQAAAGDPYKKRLTVAQIQRLSKQPHIMYIRLDKSLFTAGAAK